MYFISSTKYVNKGKMIDKTEILELEGFIMPSKSKKFSIGNTTIHDLCLLNKSLIHHVVSKKVLSKYEKLIKNLTDLLVDDDDSGNSCREALNQIERFRLEIKNKYRKYLQRKELEYMANHLSILQKEATIRLLEIRNSYYEFQNSERRSK